MNLRSLLIPLAFAAAPAMSRAEPFAIACDGEEVVKSMPPAAPETTTAKGREIFVIDSEENTISIWNTDLQAATNFCRFLDAGDCKIDIGSKYMSILKTKNYSVFDPTLFADREAGTIIYHIDRNVDKYFRGICKKIATPVADISKNKF